MISESKRRGESYPVLFETDVLVIGGGPAGVAAAVSAARAGARTALIERWPILGGMGTGALVNIWHTSDKEKEVIFGLTRELIERLKGYGGIRQLPDFPRHHETYGFSSEWLKLVCEDVIREARVRCLCYTPCVDALVDDGRIEAAIVGTKQGLRQVRASIFIDASGDGDLAAYAGARFTVGRASDGRCQGMSLVTRFNGVDLSDAKGMRRAAFEVKDKLEKMVADGSAPPCQWIYFGNDINYPWAGSGCCCTAANPLDNEDLTRAGMEAREKLPFLLEFYRENHLGCERIGLEQTGFGLGIRESRHVAGLYEFTENDIYGLSSFSDAVGHGFWMVDIHDPMGTGTTTWSDPKNHLAPGTSYQIPYRILVSADLENLFLAGRCASATHAGMAGLRLQSHCHVMGQAVGTAATMALDGGIAPRDVDAPRLQRKLRDAGVYIDEQRVAEAREREETRACAAAALAD